MLFTDGEEREVPLPQPSLFSIDNRPWSRTKEELDEQLRVLGFNVQHGVVDQEEEEEPAYHYTTYHTGAPSSSYQDEGLLRHILGTPLHSRAGIDLHLGQKPKLGGRYADDSLIYISYFVSTLYIHISLYFCSCSYFYFPKTQKDQKYFHYFSLFAFLVC
jgi:hypothetical protein